MKVLLNTHSTNEFAEGCEFAFLDIDAALAHRILERSAIFDNLYAADSSLTEMRFYDCSPIFLSAIPNDEEGVISETMADEEWIDTSIAVEDCENFAERTECDRMVITHTDVYWDCYPKHCDGHVETRPIGFEDIRKAAMEVPA